MPALALALYFFFKKEILLLLININIIKITSITDINTFMYTNPLELFLIYLKIIINIGVLYTIPYIVWSLTDFYKSAFNYSRYKLTKFLIIFNFIILTVLCFTSFYYFYPKIWFFLESLNNSFENTTFFKFNYQLQFSQYFIFLTNFLKIVSILYFLILIYCLISFLFKFNFLIKFRKLFFLLNGIFATILSPPDIISQILFFFVLNLITESLLIFFIFNLKYEVIKFYAGK